jgi:hypothetical protein
MYENKAFTGRVISTLQSIDRRNERFVYMLTMYLAERKRIAYDNTRDLFWVKLPDDTYQVAVWMFMFYEEFRVPIKRLNSA